MSTKPSMPMEGSPEKPMALALLGTAWLMCSFQLLISSHDGCTCSGRHCRICCQHGCALVLRLTAVYVETRPGSCHRQKLCAPSIDNS